MLNIAKATDLPFDRPNEESKIGNREDRIVAIGMLAYGAFIGLLISGLISWCFGSLGAVWWCLGIGTGAMFGLFCAGLIRAARP